MEDKRHTKRRATIKAINQQDMMKDSKKLSAPSKSNKGGLDRSGSKSKTKLSNKKK